MVDYGKMRYNLMGNGGHWFPGLNAAKVRDVNLTEIARQSNLGDRLVPIAGRGASNALECSGQTIKPKLISEPVCKGSKR